MKKNEHFPDISSGAVISEPEPCVEELKVEYVAPPPAPALLELPVPPTPILSPAPVIVDAPYPAALVQEHGKSQPSKCQ